MQHLEAALIVMRNGGSTVAADRSFANILAGYKKRRESRPHAGVNAYNQGVSKGREKR
jgi:hypothetical protein